MADTAKAVPVQLPDGRMGTVAPKDVASVLDQRGRVVSDTEFAANQKKLNVEAKYSSVGGIIEGQIGPNVAGGLRGLSAGLSDPLLIEGAGLISPQAKESVRGKLNEYKEAFPLASTQGEIAGIVGPALAGAGRAPVGVSGLISRGGVAVERGVLTSLGAAERGLAGRMVTKGLAVGAQGAFEGALFGAGHQISEASLGNHELTADKLLAGAKGGALYGFAGGAVLGAGGELIGSAIQAIPKTFAAASRDAGSLSQTLERKAGEFALRSAGADKRLVSSLDRFAPGGHEGVGKLLAEEAPALVGKQRVGQMTREAWAEAAQKGKQIHGNAMEAALTSAEQTATPMKAAALIDDIKRVAEPFRNDFANIGKAGIVKQIDGFADDVAKRAGLIDEAGAIINPDATLTLKDVHAVRRAADDLWAGNKINPVAKPIKGVRDAVDLRLSAELERSGGHEAVQAWKDANIRWQAFNALEKASANASAKAGSNQFLGLTDKIFASAGAGVGSLIGGGPLGGLIGGAVTGLASKALRGRFDAMAADALLKASRLNAAKQITGSVDAQIGESIGGFLEGGGKKLLPAATAMGARMIPQAAKVGGTSRDDYEKTAQQVAYLSTQQKSGQAPKTGLEEFAKAAPNVTAALAGRHVAAVDYLSRIMPPARVDSFALTVPGSMYVPKALSPAELKWLRSVEAVKDPAGVFRDFSRGHLTHDQVDALKNVYPSLYTNLKERVKEAAVKRGKNLSVEQASSLGILLGEPVHFSQRPGFVMAMQESKVSSGPVESSDGPMPSRGRPDIDVGAGNAQTMEEQIQ